MPRSFFAPNGVLYHLPAMGNTSFVAPAPTHSPSPLLSNNVIPNWGNNLQPVTGAVKAPPGVTGVATQPQNPSSFVAQPSAPVPTAHATNMYVTLATQARQNNPAGF